MHLAIMQFIIKGRITKNVVDERKERLMKTSNLSKLKYETCSSQSEEESWMRKRSNSQEFPQHSKKIPSRFLPISFIFF